MLAYRILQARTQPEFQEVPDPHAGPGQVVVKVAGSGLCHTDFIVQSRDRAHWKDNPPPFTLGHEIAGWVEEVGTGVTTFKPGDAVAVNRSWASCGRCHMCRSGEENHCLYQKAIRAPGVGYDGGTRPTSSSPRRDSSFPSALSIQFWPRRSRTPASRRTARSSLRCLTSGRGAPLS